MPKNLNLSYSVKNDFNAASKLPSFGTRPKNPKRFLFVILYSPACAASHNDCELFVIVSYLSFNTDAEI